MNSLLTSSQIMEILNLRAATAAHLRAQPVKYAMFLTDKWLKEFWTKVYSLGYTDGFLALNKIYYFDEDHLGEYQCMQHYFCLQDETRGVYNER